MPSLVTVEFQVPALTDQGAPPFVRELNCTRFSPDSDSPECEERSQIALGLIVVVVVLLLVVGSVVWRYLMRKYVEKLTEGEPGEST